MALTGDLSGFLVGKTEETPVVGVAADAVIFAGSIVGYDAGGFIDTADNAAVNRPLGIAPCGIDNTGGTDGVLANGKPAEIAPMFRGKVDLAPGPLTKADNGLTIYASDDDTLTTASNSKPLGVLVDIVGVKARIRVNS